jgi:hypothetical protein
MSFLKFCSLGLAVLAVGSGSCCLQAADLLDFARQPNTVNVLEGRKSCSWPTSYNTPQPINVANGDFFTVIIKAKDGGFTSLVFSIITSKSEEEMKKSEEELKNYINEKKEELKNYINEKGGADIDISDEKECAKFVLDVTGKNAANFFCKIFWTERQSGEISECMEVFLFYAYRTANGEMIVTCKVNPYGETIYCPVGGKIYNDIKENFFDRKRKSQNN